MDLYGFVETIRKQAPPKQAATATNGGGRRVLLKRAKQAFVQGKISKDQLRKVVLKVTRG